MNYKKSYLLILLSLLLTVLVACAGSTPNDSTDSAAEGDGNVAETADEGAGTSDIFTFAVVIDPADLDPRSNYDAAGLSVIGQLYETLTYFNAPGTEPEIASRLAESWESNEDATEWTFMLKEGVTFHDGADFNAEAVKKVVEGVRDSDYPTAWIFLPISEIEVVDDYTIKFINDYPAALDLIFSSAFGAWMISPDGMDQEGSWFAGNSSVGTGPYKIASREPGTRIVLEQHTEYWGGWNDNKFETVAVEIVEDSTVREQMIRSGDADLTHSINPDNLASLMEAEGVEVKVELGYDNYFIFINQRKEPLDNVLVRQALAHSYPYADVLAGTNGGFGTPAAGAIPQAMWGADSSLVMTQDLDKAAALLAEAGYADGGLTLEAWAFEGLPLYEQAMELWRTALAELGIELNITIIDFNTGVESAQADPENAHDFMFLQWFPTYVTPFDPMFSPFATDQYFNLSFYSNPDFEDLLFGADGMTATDRDGAIEMFQQANKMLVDEVAAIFVMDSPYLWQIRDDLSGYQYSPGYGSLVEIYNLER